ncbi:sialate O-acetylesterase [Streptococcus rupicaprae]|uniref:Sialate O-acetylesterase n=1 Tax=Streptococcus rupicaprae TaxID=759619 RepID=A0ABV2FFV9_9STRE
MLKLAPYFQNHMLLQAGAPQKVWGKAAPKATIHLCLQTHKREVLADEFGNWEILLPPLETSWQEELRVWTTDSDEICLRLAIGQLWLAGGQSNMEFHMRYEKHLQEELSQLADHIYFYDVPEMAFAQAVEYFDFSEMGKWRMADAQNVEWWSAVGYYFAKHLSRAIDSPIGVIGCNWGGTKIQSWMKLETIRELDAETFDAYQDWLQTQDMAAYWEKQRTSPLNHRGLPFEDAFGELVMPRTVQAEEFGAFLTHVGEEIKTYRSTLQPQALPASLYEHMVLQLEPVAIAGILWYQGESNDVEGKQYRYKSLLKGLITDWREVFGEETPFYIIQLPGYESWLENKAIRYDIIRNCQQEAVKETDLTYLCSISDLGERFDIHPKNKKTVGERLALLAQKHTYGYPIEADAPMLSQVTYEAGQVVLHFNHAEEGLVIRGERVACLKVEANGEALSFTERLDRDNLILRLSEAKDFTELRVSLGQSNWMTLNLYNQAGIPALPFCETIQL